MRSSGSPARGARGNIVFAVAVSAAVAFIASGPVAAQVPSPACEGEALLQLIGQPVESAPFKTCTDNWGRKQTYEESRTHRVDYYDAITAGLVIRKANEDSEETRVVGLLTFARTARAVREGLSLDGIDELALRIEQGYGVAADGKQAVVFELHARVSSEHDILLVTYSDAADPWVAFRANGDERCTGDALLDVVGQDEASSRVSMCEALWAEVITLAAQDHIHRSFPRVGVGLVLRSQADRSAKPVVVAIFRSSRMRTRIPLPAVLNTDDGSEPTVRDVDGLRVIRAGDGAVVYLPPVDGDVRAEQRIVNATLDNDLQSAFQAHLADAAAEAEAPPEEEPADPDPEPEPAPDERLPQPDVASAGPLWKNGSYRGQVDAHGNPHGAGILTYEGQVYEGLWTRGNPRAGHAFLVHRGEIYSGRDDWFNRAPLDDSLRFHGRVTIWHLSMSRTTLVGILDAATAPPGARAEGDWRHGKPIGTHVVRACDDCAAARTAEFADGEFISGDYPWSIRLLIEVEEEHQWELDAPKRAREDSLRQAREKERARQAEEDRRREEEARRRAAEVESRRRELERQLEAHLQERLANFERGARAQGARILNTYRAAPQGAATEGLVTTYLFAFRLDAVEGREDAIGIIGPAGTTFSGRLDLNGDSSGLYGSSLRTFTCESANGICSLAAGRWDETVTYAAYVSMWFEDGADPPAYIVHYER